MHNPWHFNVKIDGGRIDFEQLRGPGARPEGVVDFTPEDDAILDQIAKALGATHRVEVGPASLRRYAIVSPATGYLPIGTAKAPEPPPAWPGDREDFDGYPTPGNPNISRSAD